MSDKKIEQHTPITKKPMTHTDAHLRGMADALGVSHAELKHPIFHNYISGKHQIVPAGPPGTLHDMIDAPKPLTLQPPTVPPQQPTSAPKMMESVLKLLSSKSRNLFAEADNYAQKQFKGNVDAMKSGKPFPYDSGSSGKDQSRLAPSSPPKDQNRLTPGTTKDQSRLSPSSSSTDGQALTAGIVNSLLGKETQAQRDQYNKDQDAKASPINNSWLDTLKNLGNKPVQEGGKKKLKEASLLQSPVRKSDGMSPLQPKPQAPMGGSSMDLPKLTQGVDSAGGDKKLYQPSQSQIDKSWSNPGTLPSSDTKFNMEGGKKKKIKEDVSAWMDKIASGRKSTNVIDRRNQVSPGYVNQGTAGGQEVAPNVLSQEIGSGRKGLPGTQAGHAITNSMQSDLGNWARDMAKKPESGKLKEDFDHETHINNLKNSVHDEHEYNKHMDNLKNSKPSKADLHKVHAAVTGLGGNMFKNSNKEQLHRSFEIHANEMRRNKRRADIAKKTMPMEALVDMKQTPQKPPRSKNEPPGAKSPEGVPTRDLTDSVIEKVVSILSEKKGNPFRKEGGDAPPSQASLGGSPSPELRSIFQGPSSTTPDAKADKIGRDVYKSSRELKADPEKWVKDRGGK